MTNRLNAILSKKSWCKCTSASICWHQNTFVEHTFFQAGACPRDQDYFGLYRSPFTPSHENQYEENLKRKAKNHSKSLSQTLCKAIFFLYSLAEPDRGVASLAPRNYSLVSRNQPLVAMTSLLSPVNCSCDRLQESFKRHHPAREQSFPLQYAVCCDVS
jgi:hypothetical protein